MGRLLLLALANFADDQGVCGVEQSTLADYTEMSPRTVRLWLSKLADKGLVSPEGGEATRGERGRWDVRRYRLEMPIEATRGAASPAASHTGGTSCRRHDLPSAPDAYGDDPESDKLLTTKVKAPGQIAAAAPDAYGDDAGENGKPQKEKSPSDSPIKKNTYPPKKPPLANVVESDRGQADGAPDRGKAQAGSQAPSEGFERFKAAWLERFPSDAAANWFAAWRSWQSLDQGGRQKAAGRFAAYAQAVVAARRKPASPKLYLDRRAFENLNGDAVPAAPGVTRFKPFTRPWWLHLIGSAIEGSAGDWFGKGRPGFMFDQMAQGKPWQVKTGSSRHVSAAAQDASWRLFPGDPKRAAWIAWLNRVGVPIADPNGDAPIFAPAEWPPGHGKNQVNEAKRDPPAHAAE